LNSEGLGDDCVGCGGAVRAANGASDRGGHLPIDRLNVKGVFLAAAALDLDWYHMRVTDLPN
jgi:hypothetical protein